MIDYEKAGTQNAKILAHLKRGETITPKDALALFSCFRLAARIGDLRKLGHDIRTRLTKDGYAEYWLHREPEPAKARAPAAGRQPSLF